jgi:DNA-3-methyladenine glycosylase I
VADLVVGSDGRARCGWAAATPEELVYHDQEWGRPQQNDVRLFEKICLEGFQAGLSWRTILRKRDAFRAAFAGFDIAAVAAFTARDVERLMSDAGIVRHRGKIEAAIGNARVVQHIVAEKGSLAAYLWGFAQDEPTHPPAAMAHVPAVTATSHELSRDLRRRGARFVGPTTMYALMQAMGLVNDHLDGCHVRGAVADQRVGVLSQLRRS